MFFASVGVLLVAGVGYLLFGRQTEPATPRSPQSTNTAQDKEETRRVADEPFQLIVGRADAPITIVEYSDYKCPNCNRFYQGAYQEIKREWLDTGKARLVFRPYPLFGEDAGLALYASYCAEEQHGFPAYHDVLFEHMWDNFLSKGDTDAIVRKLFTPEKLGALAEKAGLDGNAFAACAAGETHGDAYRAAVDKAAGDSVQGAPTIIIGDQKIIGPQPYSVYKALLSVQEHQ